MGQMSPSTARQADKQPLDFAGLKSKLIDFRSALGSSKVLHMLPSSEARTIIILESYCMDKGIERLCEALDKLNLKQLEAQLLAGEAMCYVFTAMHPRLSEDSSFAKIHSNEFKPVSMFNLFISSQLATLASHIFLSICEGEELSQTFLNRIQSNLNLEMAEDVGFGPTNLSTMLEQSETPKASVKEWDFSTLSPSSLIEKKWKSELKVIESRVTLGHGVPDNKRWSYLHKAYEHLIQAFEAMENDNCTNRCVALLGSALLECLCCLSSSKDEESKNMAALKSQRYLESTIATLLRLAWSDETIRPTLTTSVRNELEELGLPRSEA